MEYTFKTKGTCAAQIKFELEQDNTIHNVQFYGGCNGNLKAISILVEGMTPQEISEKLSGNRCGMKNTSCADQLAIAVMQAAESVQ